jgi:hypothetical protein
MAKHDIGELIAALNEAVNKLNNLRTKHDDLEEENARLREALSECNVWLTAAIECKDWVWDGDQKEAAIFARDQARAALGEKE